MPRTCIVRGCPTGYPQTAAEKAEGKSPTNTKLSFHKFPMKKPELLEKWKPALCFIDCSSITNWEEAAIFQLHFKDDDYMCTDTNSKSDTRKRMRLKPEAFPQVFDVICIAASRVPQFFKPREMKLATPSARRKKKIYDAEALEKSMKISLCVADYEDLSSKLQGDKLPSDYKQVKYTENNEDIMCFQVVEFVECQAQATSCLIVRTDLTFSAFKGGQSINTKKFTVVVLRLRTNKQPRISKIDEVPNILTMLKVLECDEQDKLDAIASELCNLNMTDLNTDQQNVVCWQKLELLEGDTRLNFFSSAFSGQ